MKIIYHGHSFIELQVDDIVLFIDPFITGNSLCDISKEDVINVDYILLTHGHADHVGDTVYLAEKYNCTVIASPEICQRSTKQGVMKTHGMNIGGGYTFPFAYVYMTQAFHSSALPDGTYAGQPSGFVVQTREKTIYHAGDTSVFGDMAYIGQKFSLDIAFLPIGDNFTMGIDDAVQAAKLLNVEKVIPIHYDTFPVIKADVDAFVDLMNASGLVTTVLDSGRSL